MSAGRVNHLVKKNEKTLPSIWPYTALQQRWAPWHDMFLHRFDFCRIFFWANILTCQGKTRLFLQNALVPQITHLFAKAIQRGPISLHA